MESPKQSSEMEKMLATYASTHPEFKDLTPSEIRQAAELLAAKEGAGEAVFQEALDARLAVRNVAGKIPVKNEQGGVIGMASPDQADEMYRKDRENRDLMR